MDPNLLQKQLKDNNADLEHFYKDLKTWGETLKQREDTLSKIKSIQKPTPSLPKKSKPSTSKAKSVTFSEPPTRPRPPSTDYAAWAKFDAEAECERVDYDENADSDLTDECDEAAQEEAYAQKEAGNQHVKAQRWREAIACYSRAIDHHALDPVFYANRALCRLRLGEHAAAERDCTLALRLDAGYGKARYRRAAARERLGRPADAERDLQRVLAAEPRNAEAGAALARLRPLLAPPAEEGRPASRFTAARAALRAPRTPDGGEELISVIAVSKPVHLRSKKPLRRVEIEEVGLVGDAGAPAAVKDEIVERKVPDYGKLLKTDDLEVVERLRPVGGQCKGESGGNSSRTEECCDLVVPKTSVQFYEMWRRLESLELKYKYLKLIRLGSLAGIVKESMDVGVLSGIFEVLVRYFVENNEPVFEFLKEISEIKRFSTFTLFFSNADKKHLWKLFDYVKSIEKQPLNEVCSLIEKFEL